MISAGGPRNAILCRFREKGLLHKAMPFWRYFPVLTAFLICTLGSARPTGKRFNGQGLLAGEIGPCHRNTLVGRVPEDSLFNSSAAGGEVTAVRDHNALALCLLLERMSRAPHVQTPIQAIAIPTQRIGRDTAQEDP